MDTAPLVEDEIADGRKLIEQLVSDGFDVTVAFWIRFQFEEDGPWFYIVSKIVDQEGLHPAYRAIHQALHRIPAPWGPWTSVTAMGELKLVGVNDPLAKAVMAFHDRYPGRNRFRRPDLANHRVEEIYIYPQITPSTAVAKSGGKLRINVGTAAEPQFIDLEKVPLVTIVRDSAGSSKVVLVGGGKPQRTLEGEEAQRFLAEFDAISKQLEATHPSETSPAPV
jgi:hypothetical protein